MGSGSGDNDEKPVHKVTFTKPFWMSKTEITFDQYDAFAKIGRSVSRPMIYVSWSDTQGYVK